MKAFSPCFRIFKEEKVISNFVYFRKHSNVLAYLTNILLTAFILWSWLLVLYAKRDEKRPLCELFHKPKQIHKLGNGMYYTYILYTNHDFIYTVGTIVFIP